MLAEPAPGRMTGGRRRWWVAVTDGVERLGVVRADSGILADPDIASGRLTWINRGHLLPILIRGDRWTTELACPPDGPMGADLGLPVTERTEQLQPGDRLLCYPDGITEARDAHGDEFGRDRFVGDRPARRVARRLPHTCDSRHTPNK
ncbi:PP2C family protein-serine/threonine phosphatase [Streptomyces misionensis]|uniref:PP2C family protein-serine/threonine phosphatase n=1 Tax=Streptomyces misionensis TaxID=67331 RepID=UPI0009451404|nr:PP2C family protein-serine/threonine phosphatase [Streptomyces misionensis]